jgi:hypothetical protein
MSRGQRGASLLIPALLLLTVGAFAVVVAATQAGADIQGTDAQAEASEALFLAETGVERAVRRFLAGSACSAAGLGENIADLSTIGLASGRTLAISAGANSGNDFAGTALAATQCRIQVTAQITASNVSRTVQTIIDRSENYIGAAAVAGFDNPAGATPVASWTGGSYDYTGGNIAGAVNPNNCTRSAYAVKPRTGGASSQASSIGTAPVSFTVNRPLTLLVTFDYRIVRIGNSGSNTCVSASGGGACPGAADATSPSGAAGDGEICFTLRDTAGGTYDSTKSAVDSSQNLGGGVQVVGPACTPTTQQLPTNAAYTPCSLLYNYSNGSAPGNFTGRATVRFTFAGTGTLSFDRIGFNMFIPAGGQAFEMWIDNVLVQPSTGAIAGVAAWRDCAVSTCPAV